MWFTRPRDEQALKYRQDYAPNSNAGRVTPEALAYFLGGEVRNDESFRRLAKDQNAEENGLVWTLPDGLLGIWMTVAPDPEDM